MVQVLDRVTIGAQQVDGYWVRDIYGFYRFVPLVGETELDHVSQTTLFYTPAEVTGEILSYGLIIDGYPYDKWNVEAQVGQGFKITARGVYHAASKKQTRMDVTVWRPDGSIIEASDLDMIVNDPDDPMDFVITASFGRYFNINVAGTWLAELRYVWVG